MNNDVVHFWKKSINMDHQSIYFWRKVYGPCDQSNICREKLILLVHGIMDRMAFIVSSIQPIYGSYGSHFSLVNTNIPAPEIAPWAGRPYDIHPVLSIDKMPYPQKCQNNTKIM